MTLCCVSQESVFLLKIKSIEIWHRLVGTCLSYFSQFLPPWLAVGVGVFITWWRWAFSHGLIEGADYDACRSFQQILTWKQWERTTPRFIALSSHTGCFARQLCITDTHTHTPHTHTHTNIMHLRFTGIFTNIHMLMLCAHKDAQKPIIPIDGVSSAS